jgi:hypothetical protein
MICRWDNLEDAVVTNDERVHVRIAALALATVSILACGRTGPSSGPIALTVPGKSTATPWVAASGSFVAVAFGATNAGATDIFVAVSRDAGRTFAAPTLVNSIAGEGRLGGELPPRVALSASNGSKEPEVAVVWTARGTSTEIKAARSRDGGKTFEPPVTLQNSGAPGMRGWPALTIDPHGTAHSIWLDHRGMTPTAEHGAGNHSGHRSDVPQDGVAMAQKSGLFYAAASGPSTGEHELTKGVCYCCKTALAAAADGTLYAAWRHVYEGNLRDMALTVSHDGGRTFSEPVRVSEDRWAINGCPDDGPAMAVDNSGVAHLVWPTVIDGPQPEGGIFYASTRDGKQFTSRIRIPTLGSPKPSHPQILVAGGRVVVAWDELVNGRRVATAREVKRQADGTATFGAPIDLAPGESAVYPVLAATDDALVAVWTSGSGDQSTVRARTLRLP